MKRLIRFLLAIISGVCISTMTSCTLFSALIPAPTATRTTIPTLTALPTLTPQQLQFPQTPTLEPATATIPVVIMETPTVTPVPSTVTVKIETTAKGTYLVISRSTDNLNYTLGPLADGAYVIGPNDKFLVYCTNGGTVLAARLGQPYLTKIGSVKFFSAINRDVPPSYQITIFQNNNTYKVKVLETNFYENKIFNIPGGIAK